MADEGAGVGADGDHEEGSAARTSDREDDTAAGADGDREDDTAARTSDREDDGERHRQSRLFTTDDGGFDAERARSESLPIEDGEVIDTDDLAEYQTYVEGRGVYDERNAVNDLTGREWKYATKSVIAEGYPPALQHDLRSEHGGQKPPRLCAQLIGRFSKAGDTILDPFAGVGGTLLGASLCEHEGTGRREAIGFETNRRWVELYDAVLERENEQRHDRGEPPLAGQEMRHGDCADLIDDVPDDSIDLILTDVPYWNMDELEQTRNERATRESNLGSFDAGPSASGDGASDPAAERTSGEGTTRGTSEEGTTRGTSEEGTATGEISGDGTTAEATVTNEATDGAQATLAEAAGDDHEGTDGETKAAWLADVATKFERFADAVKPGGYALVFIGDMYREQSYRFLSADLARAIEERAPVTLKATLIWYDPTKDLHVYGYPFSFVPSMVHQNVLVFRTDREA